MRIRISYKKTQVLRFTGALDMQRIWERSFRRAGVPIAYSQGFRPKARIQLGLPLPLGFIGLGEKVDIWLSEAQNISGIQKKLLNNVPNGIIIEDVIEIENKEKPLVSQLESSEYHVRFHDGIQNVNKLNSIIKNFLGQTEILLVKRNGKEYNLRPLVFNIEMRDDPSGETYIYMLLSSRVNKTGRADEVMRALGFSLADFIVERVRSFTK